MAERTDGGGLFQRDRAQEQKTLVPVLVSTLGTDKRYGSDAASIEWR